jgi:hypothetical protein
MTKGYLNPFKPVWVAIPCDNGHYRGRRRQEGGSMSKHTPGPWTTNLMDEFLAVLRAVRGSVADSLMGGCQSFDDFHDSLSDALDAIDATIEDATKEEA